MSRISKILIVFGLLWARPASAQGFVQGTAIDSTAALSSYTIAYTSTVTAGNTLGIVFAYNTGGNTPTITGVHDNINGNWTIGAKNDGGTSGGCVAYFLNSGSGTITVTIDLSISSNGFFAIIREINGYPTFDVSAFNNQFLACGSPPCTDQITSTAATTTAADYIFGGTSTFNGGSASVGTGFTQREVHAGNDNELGEELIQSGAGSQAATFTTSAANMRWMTGMLAFKAAGGGCTPTLNTLGVSQCGP